MHTQVVSKGFGEKICLEDLWEGLQDGASGWDNAKVSSCSQVPNNGSLSGYHVSTAKGTSSKSNSHWDAIGDGENRYKIKRQNKQNPHKTRNWENEVEYHIPRDCCLSLLCIWAQKGRRNGYQAYVRLPTKGEVQRLGYTGPGQVLKSGGGSGALNKGTSFCICTLLIRFVGSGVRKKGHTWKWKQPQLPEEHSTASENLKAW